MSIPLPHKPDLIYFVQDGDFIKIGHVRTEFNSWCWSREVRNRVTGLNAGNPRDLVLLGVIAGSITRETLLHKIFEEQHHRGEWFKINARLHHFIKRVAKHVPIAVRKIGFRTIYR